MLLSIADIRRLKRKGYHEKSFVRFNKAGYAILQNRQGYCFFYDAEKQRCKVYADRPLGCRVYPVILNETRGIVVDAICHAQNSVTEKEKARKGKKVLELLQKIDAEAKKRRSAQFSSKVFDSSP
jgi:Fe-S-cluster containining protein